jgi:hypothetical protein
MTTQRSKLIFVGLASLLLLTCGEHRSGRVSAADAVLPPGVKAVWDLSKAHRETTATRERVSLNGLWRWQPGGERADAVPADAWGYFKVPGFWPGNPNYIQEDCQTLYTHPAWKNADLRGLTAAWYQREIIVPEAWAGRRITLRVENLNSFAVVYVDGKKAGEIRFPSGEADLSAVCRPGGKHLLSLFVVALPLKGVMLSYSDTNAAREVKGTVERRGLCGDVSLNSAPATTYLSDVKVETSVRKGEITISAAVHGLVENEKYSLMMEIGSTGTGLIIDAPFSSSQLKNGNFIRTEKWKPETLWDIHTPQNRVPVRVWLDKEGPKRTRLDAYFPLQIGFREFWIDGRNFYLNGKRIYLSAVPLDNGQLGARAATYEGARETLKRLQSFGINLVYTHNYGCQPGSHVSFEQILRAADDVGMLVALSQPHFGHYDWKTDRDNGYARHAEAYVEMARHHPSVVAYSMSHNATGYDEDMNPDLIDGVHDPRNDTWSKNNAERARLAEAIVKGLDPRRIVYHHSSGNLGSMHTCNFYLNWVPIQELSDWFEHWATDGVKPVFLVEYGVPFTWDWAMYRGWYKGERSFGSAKVPWEFCLAEWDAQFLGDAAFRISEMERKNLRWEAKQFQAGNLWQRWQYPHQLGSANFDERQPVMAAYLADNWRAFRTWGLSANSPWEYAAFWKLRDGVDRGRKEFKVDWDNLQRPGFSPDFTQRQSWQMSQDFEAADWVPTPAAQALLRNNRPLLAYVGGKPDGFTSKDHNFRPGESVEKQLIVINNSRETVACECEWSLALPRPASGGKKVSVRTGDQERIPLRFDLPRELAAGQYELTATVRFSNSETQKDTFTVNVLPAPSRPTVGGKVALFDPKGETGKILAGLEVPYQKVDASADLSGYDVLIVGKEALTADGPGPDVSRMREGLKVIVFEQTAKVLEQRFGFRVTEYGLRQVFPRVPDHPLLAGLDVNHLHDWRGSATILPPRLPYTLKPQHGPTVQWCGIDVSRVWRCGNLGNVASVLIEKPARGDFLPVLDGGYSLQYSPLLQYREGKGTILFCQMDVTGRTESDPAADALTRNLIRHVTAWKPQQERKAVYVGDPAGKRHLEAAGVSLTPYTKSDLSADRVLIVGPGGGKALAGDAAAIGQWLKEGGKLLAVGLDGADAEAFLPFKVAVKKGEHIASYFGAPGVNSPLAGVGPADVHNRDPRELSLVSGGAALVGDGVLARADNADVVFCQLVPWQFDPTKQMNLKRTFRRSSFLLTRLAANMGVTGSTPVLARFRTPVEQGERRWLEGLYLDVPEEWDDPYRFFRW